jgi:excisionase family DNA binding protein
MVEKQPTKTYYIIPEVAKELNLSVVTVRRYVKDKKIKGFYKLGRDWRIEKEKLEEFIKEVKNQGE